VVVGLKILQVVEVSPYPARRCVRFELIAMSSATSPSC
jgi:hypothetical protein